MRLASRAESSRLVVKLNTETKASRRLHTTGPCLHITFEVFSDVFTARARGWARGDDAIVSRPQPPEIASIERRQSHQRRAVIRLEGGGDGGAVGAVVICTQSREDCRGVYATCTQDREGREGRVEKSLKVGVG